MTSLNFLTLEEDFRGGLAARIDPASGVEICDDPQAFQGKIWMDGIDLA
jgi:hypothetical protein